MNNKSDNLFSGIFLLSLCHVGYCIVTLVLFLDKSFYTLVHTVFCPELSETDEYIGLAYWAWSIAALCFVQAVYAIPLYRYYNKKGLRKVANGIAIAALITFFWTGSCFVSFLGSEGCRTYSLNWLHGNYLITFYGY